MDIELNVVIIVAESHSLHRETVVFSDLVQKCIFYMKL